MASGKNQIDLRRFVQLTIVEDGRRVVVGGGNKLSGQRGVVVAIIALKHDSGYEVVVHLDSGKQESFSPLNLFPEQEHPHE